MSMGERRARTLAEFYRRLDETGQADDFVAAHPELEEEIRAHLLLRQDLTGLRAEGPEPVVVATKRRLVLSSIPSNAVSEGERMSLKKLTRVAGPIAALCVFAVAALSAGAASGTVNVPGVSNVLGMSEQGGPSTPGPSNSEHNQKGKPAGTEDVIDDSVGATEGTPTDPLSPDATPTPTHGQVVSTAVHGAIASSTPGPERGIAVSQAACTAAHDRTTLPQGAQQAPGQAERTPTACVHPNADGTPGKGHATQESTPTIGATQESTGTGQGNNGQGSDHGNGQSGNHGKGNQ
jgi:hypothetical protein